MKTTKFTLTLFTALALTSGGCGEITAPVDGEGNPESDPIAAVASPSRGSALGGTTVTVTGTGFIEGTTVIVGSRVADATTVVSETELSFVAPVGSELESPQDILVFNDNGSSLLPEAYTYNDFPVADLVQPSFVGNGGGQDITITGFGFETNNAGEVTVLVGGSEATDVVVVDDVTITAKTPSLDPQDLGTAQDVTVDTTNGSTTVEESLTFIAPGLLFGAARTNLEDSSLFYIQPGNPKVSSLLQSKAAFGKLTRMPGGGILARFNNGGTEPLFREALGRLDIEDGSVELLGAMQRVGGGVDSARAITTVGTQVFAVNGSTEFGTLDVDTLVHTPLGVSLGGRSGCMAPASAPNTVVYLERMDVAVRTIDTTTGLATTLNIPTGDILPGTDVRCHGADVFGGVVHFIQYDRNTGISELSTINVATGVVTKVSDLPSFASGLLALEIPN